MRCLQATSLFRLHLCSELTLLRASGAMESSTCIAWFAMHDVLCMAATAHSHDEACCPQDPDAGPAMVGDACTQVKSVRVPTMTVQWTCGIAVKGDFACGGGASPVLLHALLDDHISNYGAAQPCA